MQPIGTSNSQVLSGANNQKKEKVRPLILRQVGLLLASVRLRQLVRPSARAKLIGQLPEGGRDARPLDALRKSRIDPLLLQSYELSCSPVRAVQCVPYQLQIAFKLDIPAVSSPQPPPLFVVVHYAPVQPSS